MEELPDGDGTKYCPCLCHRPATKLITQRVDWPIFGYQHPKHCSACCTGSAVTKRNPEIQYMEISIWHKGQSPVDDPPRERAGIMQDTLEATIGFATEMIRAHWNAECDCQQKKKGDSDDLS